MTIFTLQTNITISSGRAWFMKILMKISKLIRQLLPVHAIKYKPNNTCELINDTKENT